MELMTPMLAEAVDVRSLVDYADTPEWAFEQKVDGQRVLIHVDNKSVTPISRDGRYKRTFWTTQMTAEFTKLTGQWVFDGEIIAGTLWLFDMPCGDGVTTATPYGQRRAALAKVFKAWKPFGIKVLPSYTDLEDKVALARTLMVNGGEGVMVKRLDASYLIGKRSSKNLKAKFVNDVDCIATGLRRNGKSNIVVSAYDNDRLVEIGEVTALAGDGARIQVGDVLVVRYLYATTTKEGNPRLYQPTLPKIRTDKDAEDCTVDQLVYSNKEIISV